MASNSDEATARFISGAVDWKRVVTGLVIGIPMASATYYASERVTAFALANIERRLDVQRTPMREDNAKFEARVQRDIDVLRQDIRDLREQLHRSR